VMVAKLGVSCMNRLYETLTKVRDQEGCRAANRSGIYTERVRIDTPHLTVRGTGWP